ncbi:MULTISPECIES: aldo/keto reductase [unclassified Mesorhizobium]|uniref:aldo/keto reductase n=1 Tax=unclassified Mesorhizobium TaxID=325217 RepID=UPI00112E49A2|nr:MULTISPECIES: aldo/keto reductase [unclassified Mesorhizobium]MBZ9897819.1 aldo/keto reductase [Mesorhizobium sp. BR1-1-6]MCA0060314.1 aldo/keto reductase [Mesorhizobium sp. B261B1A]TPK68337.1 aldo/keto reductase [Mesorhizobium sp. B2-5-1]TPL10508.1 aldo/keto reductase [Mesorhizobium sp. B2-4-11]TPM62582.1 aldo/keto reductase [Mesorhizobium sp. B2-1-9]
MPEQISLNDGSTIPRLGLGVWQVDPAITAKVVGWGIKAGYRLIDTAEGYQNEKGVGEAIRSAGVPRGELFITSKLRNGAHQRDAALRAFDDTMDKLGIEQIDLFLIHWPVPSQDKYVEAWQTLIELQKAGRIKSVGVSNFNRDHLERIIGETGVTPAVNQIELHPRFQQREIREFHARHNIHTESWSPLGSGRLLSDATIAGIAAKHGKSAAQTMIRWHLQEGLIVIPKSVHQDRISANFDVFDFELDAQDLKAIRGMDSTDGRVGPNPATAAFLF